MNISKGQTEELYVGYRPVKFDLPLYWESSDPSVVTVADGVVTGVGTGTAEITVKCGKCSDRCSVVVIREGFVDLGLSVYWATCNLGAKTQEEMGDYYAWGEIEPYYLSGQAQQKRAEWKEGKKEGYAWSSYRWCNGSFLKQTKYCFNPD